MTALLKAHFPWFLAGGILCGLFTSDALLKFEVLNDYCVAAVIFAGFFARPVVKDHAWNWLPFLRGYGLQKLVLPLALYFATTWVFPGPALGLALIAALPAAAISPAISRLTGGDVTFSLHLLTYESLFSCLTIPVVFAVATAGSFVVSPVDVALYLFGVLLVPMALAEGLRFVVGRERASATKSAADIASIVLIVILVTIIAAVVKPVLVKDPLYSVGLLAFSILLAPAFAAIGVFTGRPENRPRAISMAVKTMYINIGLGLGLAASHLDEQATLLILTYMIPINMLPRLAAWVGARMMPAE